MTAKVTASLTGVTKTYATGAGKYVRALADVTFALESKHRLTAVIGPDGSGKSTLLKLLCGLEVADVGSVATLEKTPDPDDPDLLMRIAFMPQQLGLYQELSCEENLLLIAQLRGLAEDEAKAKSDALLKLTGLGKFWARPAGKLSGGMKQKLALAGALLASPDLLLLDEPTVGVDPLSRRELWSVLRQRLAADEKMSVIFSTAYLEEAQEADYVLFLEDGKLVASGTPESLMQKAQGLAFALNLDGLGPEDAARLQRRMMTTVRAADAQSVWLDAVPREGRIDLLLVPGARPALPEGVDTARLGAREPRLEDSYALLTFSLSASGMEESLDKVQQARQDATTLSRAVVEAKKVRRVFGDFVAVDDTTFDVMPGEIFGILGPNGAGKTTTFRMLCSLLPMSGGEIKIAGYDLARAKAQARSVVGYVAQKFSLYGKLTVRENLRFFGRSFGLRGKGLEARIEELMHDFDLQNKADFAALSLSLGAQRDLSIACGLIHRPKIIFLDEATSGADLAARRALWRRIVALASQGAAVVVTTHFMEEAEYCDRFLIQDAGKIIALGTPDEIRQSASDETHASRGMSIETAFIRIVEKERRDIQTKGEGQ
ncbi:MAG: ATP-binding cassette domain-containing protein [Sutterellaceae bacterium]|nr:ATP-binding cassette domain-containing protein [Sutterellaceae bacterium]